MIGILIRAPYAEMITPKHDPEWAERTKRLIEECGRVSHKSEGRIKEGSADPFIQKIALNYGHESILEHGTFTACLIGSRSMSHQLVRHRLAAITQESQRFCDYASEKKQEDADTKMLQVIMPPSIMRSKGLWNTRVTQPSKSRPQDMMVEGRPILAVLEEIAKREDLPKEAVEDAFDWCADQIHAYRAYLRARDRGIPAEDARSHLTNACKTEVYVTYNWRMWRHVIGHPKCGRALNDHAQWEIKGLFLNCLRYFKEHIPLLFNDMEAPEPYELSARPAN
jgi:thymidylate synthase (FAD)